MLSSTASPDTLPDFPPALLRPRKPTATIASLPAEILDLVVEQYARGRQITPKIQKYNHPGVLPSQFLLKRQFAVPCFISRPFHHSCLRALVQNLHFSLWPFSRLDTVVERLENVPEGSIRSVDVTWPMWRKLAVWMRSPPALLTHRQRKIAELATKLFSRVRYLELHFQFWETTSTRDLRDCITDRRLLSALEHVV
jgi:hypothetical protein